MRNIAGLLGKWRNLHEILQRWKVCEDQMIIAKVCKWLKQADCKSVAFVLNSGVRIPLLALFVVACENGPRNTIPPEQAAEKFLADMEVGYKGKPNCTAIDADHDGYVTCTVSLKGDKMEFMQLQCASLTGQNGCGNNVVYAVGCKPVNSALEILKNG